MEGFEAQELDELDPDLQEQVSGTQASRISLWQLDLFPNS